MTIGRAALAVAAVLVAWPAQAAELMKPFVLAETRTGDAELIVADVRRRLQESDFSIVGSYSPYEGATVLAVTDEALKRAAAQSRFGGYGAGQRVAITKVADQVQVTYTYPPYMAAAYRMKADLTPVAGRLAAALGHSQSFGADEGMTAEALREYHYMFGMEYFTDPHVLAEHPDHATAVAEVEQGLAEGRMGITKVYRIDIPGKDEVVFGVAMNGAKGGGEQQDDAYLMREIDFKALRSTAHLPYEMLVSGRKVYALSARFRIAINFPDLSMIGANSFMNIMGSPDAIRTALTAVAGGEPDSRLPQFND